MSYWEICAHVGIYGSALWIGWAIGGAIRRGYTLRRENRDLTEKLNRLKRDLSDRVIRLNERTSMAQRSLIKIQVEGFELKRAINK